MTKKLFLLLICFPLSVQLLSQNDIFCEQIVKLKTLVNNSHYIPKAINDSLSKGVHKLFIEGLDKNRRFFTKADIQAFNDDVYQFDDYLVSNDCGFLKPYIKILNQRINESKSYLEALKGLTLDYTGKDTLYFDMDLNFEYYKNEASAKKYWNKKIRYNIITEIIEKDSVYENVTSNFKNLEENIKPKIVQNELCLLDELLNQNGGIEQFVEETFLNSFLNYHDPNSIFLSTTDKTLFESSVAKSQLSFGISTSKNENGDIVISYISPGSPAFKNVNLEVNDIIKSLRFNDEILDTNCVSNQDIASFMNDDKKNTLVFKIKKTNGHILDVQLTKKIIEVESNSVRGYLIKNNHTIGYVKIPSFYTDLESPNGLGMANDFAKEIYKLKKENIVGLIIDLRFNGGGSMKEATDLSGMFIDRGPVSIIKHNNGETFTIKDYKRGTIFNKPVIILVNYFSASASELFSSVMQDYNRAIIVGTNTHGKSTAQVILPLDENHDIGLAKITVEKFYRPTGKSHQLIGVIPDIILPSIYDDFKTQERYTDFALKNDNVEPTIKVIPLKQVNIDELKTQSNKRLSVSKSFTTISKMNKDLLDNYLHKKKQYPLTLKDIYKDIESYKSLWKHYSESEKAAVEILKLENTSYTTQLLKYDESALQSNISTLNELSEDPTLKEAYNITVDLININTTN